MSKTIIITAISAVLTLGATTPTLADTSSSPSMMGNISGMEKCYGIAKAGENDCSTANNTCAGESKVSGDKEAWILVPTGVCHKIIGSNTKA